MVSPIPESNSENIGSVMSSSVESLSCHILKTSGSMLTASHQINNQEPKIKNEYSKIENEQEQYQKVESGLEDLCPDKLITKDENVRDIQADEYLNAYSNTIKHSDSVIQEDSVKKATLVSSKNDLNNEKSLTQEEIMTDTSSDIPYDLSSSFIGQLLKSSLVTSCFCDLSSTFMAELIEDQLHSISETDFDDPFRSNSHEHQMISIPKYDQVPNFEAYQIVLSTASPRPISEILKEASSRQKKKTQRAKDLPNIKINSSQCETFDSSKSQESAISKDSKSKLSTVHFPPMLSEEEKIF